MNYIGNLKRMILCPINRENSYVLESINDEQEKELDDNGGFIFIKGAINVKIGKQDIRFYGNVDINNKDDVEALKKHNLVDTNLIHSWMPAEFDYETGTGKVENRIPKIAPTIDPVRWFKYVHCRLGKPEKVVAYRIKNVFLK